MLHYRHYIIMLVQSTHNYIQQSKNISVGCVREPTKESAALYNSKDYALLTLNN
jgi:hypothetical protein